MSLVDEVRVSVAKVGFDVSAATIGGVSVLGFGSGTDFGETAGEDSARPLLEDGEDVTYAFN